MVKREEFKGAIGNECEELRGAASKRCEKLANRIGLASGGLRVTVSHGNAVKIEVCQHARVRCVRRDANDWIASADECELAMEGAPDYVVEYLETLIVALVGRFGYLETHLENGEVVELLTNTSTRPASKRSSRNRSQGFCQISSS